MKSLLITLLLVSQSINAATLIPDGSELILVKDFVISNTTQFEQLISTHGVLVPSKDPRWDDHCKATTDVPANTKYKYRAGVWPILTTDDVSIFVEKGSGYFWIECFTTHQVTGLGQRITPNKEIIEASLGMQIKIPPQEEVEFSLKK